MAPTPEKLRIRAYNVGFGDCFLLSFHYAEDDSRHMLIDFGTTHPAKSGAPKSMTQVAEQIAEDCDGKLHVVVATHRHADHVSGFAGAPGEIIAGLDPDLVVQPWTERPDLAPDATAPSVVRSGGGVTGSKAAVAQLANVHLVAEVVTRDIPRLAASKTVPRTVIEQLEFLGADNVRNSDAVHALARLGRKRVYANFGSKLPVRRLLPGVDIDVLGPPTLRQSTAVSRQARVSDEFWHLTASSARARLSATGGTPIFPRAETERTFPQEARWVIPRIDRTNAEETLSIVRILDEVMNNTSLILLLDIGGTLLLFPGDAQLENWSYALRDAPNAAEIRARVAGTRVYKVGHHGSLNATPKTLLWSAFSRAAPDVAPDERLITVVSTCAGQHGSEARGTEVPRRTLVSELEARTTYVTTQKGTTAKAFWRDVELALSP